MTFTRALSCFPPLPPSRCHQHSPNNIYLHDWTTLAAIHSTHVVTLEISQQSSKAMATLVRSERYLCPAIRFGGLARNYTLRYLVMAATGAKSCRSSKISTCSHSSFVVCYTHTHSLPESLYQSQRRQQSTRKQSTRTPAVSSLSFRYLWARDSTP